MDGAGGGVRLAELLGPLSLVTDLGMGQPQEEAMRACLVATALARHMGMAEPDVADVYHVTLLRHVGCTATSHEEAALFGGDELIARPVLGRSDFGDVRELPSTLRRLGKATGMGTARATVGFFNPRGKRIPRAICEVASLMAERLGLPGPVARSLLQSFERWDGKGLPGKLRGEQLEAAIRVAEVATQAAAFYEDGGTDAAVAMARRRRGGWLDPAVADALIQKAGALLPEAYGGDALSSMLEAEPKPHRVVPAGRLDDVARAFADVVDLKTPFTHGHSVQVAELAAAAGAGMKLPDHDVRELRRAALFHDLGRVGVPAGVWEAPGPLGTADWERVRLHAYHTERILARSPALASIAAVAGMHHERLDGSGYHRQVSGGAVPMPARILAAADAYQAMTHDRPHRPAFPPERAADLLAQECERGRIDPEAGRFVLAAAGQERRAPHPTAPAGLSGREVEVLRLLAAGLSNRDIAGRLYVSPRTAEHHVQHIYAKIGLSTRAGAAMFAMEHGLVG